jgi:hypothetical protein
MLAHKSELLNAAFLSLDVVFLSALLLALDQLSSSEATDELGQTLRAKRKLDYALVRNDFRSGYFGAGNEYKSLVPTDLVHVSVPECLEFPLSRV